MTRLVRETRGEHPFVIQYAEAIVVRMVMGEHCPIHEGIYEEILIQVGDEQEHMKLYSISSCSV